MKKLLFCVVAIVVAMFVLTGPSGLANAEPVGSASPSPAVTQEADEAAEETVAVEESAPAPAEKQSPAAEKETDKPAPEKEQVVVQPTSAPKPESSEAQEAEEVTEPENTPAQSTEADKPAPEKEQPVATPTAATPTESTDPVESEDPTEPENTPAQPTELLPIDVFTEGVVVKATNPKGNSITPDVVVDDSNGDEHIIRHLAPGETKSTGEIKTCNVHVYIVVDGAWEFWGELQLTPNCSATPKPVETPNFEGVLVQECTANGHVFTNPEEKDLGWVTLEVLQGGKVIAKQPNSIHPGNSWTVKLPEVKGLTYRAYWVWQVEGEPVIVNGDVKWCGGDDPVPTPTGKPTVKPTPSTKPTAKPTSSVKPSTSAKPSTKPTTSTKPTSSTKPSAKPTATASAKPSKPAAKPTSSAKPGLPGAGKDGKSDDRGAPSTGVTESGSPVPAVAAIFALLFMTGLAAYRAHKA